MSDFDPEVFRRAGIATRHLRGLVPVSRPTVSMWLHGRQRPNHFIADEVSRVQQAVEAALADGRLPVSESLPAGYHRDRRIVATIREYMGVAASSEEGEGTAA